MRRILPLSGAVAALWPAITSAQIISSPVQKIGVAKVTLSKSCKEFAGREPTFKGILPTAGSPFVPIIGGLLGDVASAGLDAIATALETASQEHAYGAAGRTNFEFYDLDASQPNVAVPRLGTDIQCITIEVPGPLMIDEDGLANWPPAGYNVSGKFVSGPNEPGNLTAKEASDLRERLTLKNPVALRVEAQVVLMRDGFYVKPVYINYATRLDGAPSKALPAELHVNLSLPSSVKDGAAAESVFAIARIALPKLKPGDIWWAEQIPSESALLPFRADDGTTAALKLALAGASARSRAQEDLAAAAVQIAHAIGVRYNVGTGKVTGCVAVSCPDYLAAALPKLKAYSLEELIKWARRPGSKLPKEALTALDAGEKAYDTAILAIDQNNGRLATTGAAKNAAGSTTLEARVILTRSQNKFGMAVASALKKQEPSLASAVSGVITKDTPAWSQARSDLVLAKFTVTQREAALARAQATGDPTEIENAQLSLLQAKLDVNLKSSALGQPIPYPDLER